MRFGKKSETVGFGVDRVPPLDIWETKCTFTNTIMLHIMNSRK
jgi:hypothetical protein